MMWRRRGLKNTHTNLIVFPLNHISQRFWSAGYPWPPTQIPDLPVGGAGDSQRGSLLRARWSVHMSGLHRAHSALHDSRQGGSRRHILPCRSLRDRSVGPECDAGYVGTVWGLRRGLAMENGFILWHWNAGVWGLWFVERWFWRTRGCFVVWVKWKVRIFKYEDIGLKRMFYGIKLLELRLL